MPVNWDMKVLGHCFWKIVLSIYWGGGEKMNFKRLYNLQVYFDKILHAIKDYLNVRQVDAVFYLNFY